MTDISLSKISRVILLWSWRRSVLPWPFAGTSGIFRLTTPFRCLLVPSLFSATILSMRLLLSGMVFRYAAEAAPGLQPKQPTSDRTAATCLTSPAGATNETTRNRLHTSCQTVTLINGRLCRLNIWLCFFILARKRHLTGRKTTYLYFPLFGFPRFFFSFLFFFLPSTFFCSQGLPCSLSAGPWVLFAKL